MHPPLHYMWVGVAHWDLKVEAHAGAPLTVRTVLEELHAFFARSVPGDEWPHLDSRTRADMHWRAQERGGGPCRLYVLGEDILFAGLQPIGHNGLTWVLQTAGR